MRFAGQVWAYVCACFWAAVQFRQRVKAVGGLIAALLALPVVWALGGTLEPTATGLWWIAAWFTVSSLLLLFVISPFFLWLEATQANAKVTVPISLSCRVREQEQLPKGSPLTKWVQIVVDPGEGADLVDCEVQLVAIYRDGERLYDEALNCTWSNSQDIRRTIRAGIPYAANLCMAVDGKTGLQLTTSVNKPQIIRAMRRPESAVYRIDVAIHAADSRAKREWVVLKYGGDFAHIDIRRET